VVQWVSLFTLKAAAYHAGDVLIFGVAVYLYKVLSDPPFILSPLCSQIRKYDLAFLCLKFMPNFLFWYACVLNKL
ncbi:hypothetical protein AB6E21_17830, partial [Photobacterium swingsii]|uniref:hypothetical protein n=1 Tax=Photobacterium swingsii TaxID=680026 RepID=UPI00354B3E32